MEEQASGYHLEKVIRETQISLKLRNRWRNQGKVETIKASLTKKAGGWRVL